MRSAVCLAILIVLSTGLALAQTPVAAPPNAPAAVKAPTRTAKASQSTPIDLRYAGRLMLGCRIDVVAKGRERAAVGVPFCVSRGETPGDTPAVIVREESTTGKRGEITQTVRIDLEGGTPDLTIRLRGVVIASNEAFAVETRHGAQDRFPCVRNSIGVSRSRRNNAVYDRQGDWLISSPGGDTTLVMAEDGFARERTPNDSEISSFSIECLGRSIQLTFRPRFYGKHKNLSFFKPWTYRVWRDSVTGWCSWWPYRAEFAEEDLKALLEVFREKSLRDYGYRYIQIDDTFQQEPPGPPPTWLVWNEKFPSGIAGYVKMTRDAGFEPGIWIGAMFQDQAFVQRRTAWFIPGSDGKPLKAPWLGYGVDTTVPEVIEKIVRPIFRGIKQQGFTYVKVDTLRHLLYDAMYHARDHFKKKGESIEDAFRRYLATVREELGRDVYLLACWGVLPEVIGIADGCRLGTDRFGPAKLQQYNSWNGVVWRNDPDHCDIRPDPGGDVRDTIIRPVIVSMAGAVLMLSDRAEVYRDEKNLSGVRRASPVLFTVPGQVYDVDPVTSDKVIEGLRPNKGGGVGPIDAKHDRPVCPWWLLEVDRPYEHWLVAARFNFSEREKLPRRRVALADLGLAPDVDYLVYEYWSNEFLGARRGAFPAAEQDPKSVRIYSIRRKLDHPQILSTSRHISQGAVDLARVVWNDKTRELSGTSRVIQGDRYVITLHVPERYTVVEARFGDDPAETTTDGPVVRIAFQPVKTDTVAWTVRFE